jgi:Rod binding domain-containing protein
MTAANPVVSVPVALLAGDNATSPLQPGAGQTPESVSREFESLFWSILLKTMRTTVSEEGLFAGDQSDTYGGMFDLFMSQHLASTSSLGVGNLLNAWQTFSTDTTDAALNAERSESDEP